MELKIQNEKFPPGKYMINRQNRWWNVKALSDGTIFIKPIEEEVCATFGNYYFNKLKLYLLKFLGNRVLHIKHPVFMKVKLR
jgi:hypothetical protein